MARSRICRILLADSPSFPSLATCSHDQQEPKGETSQATSRRKVALGFPGIARGDSRRTAAT